MLTERTQDGGSTRLLLVDDDVKLCRLVKEYLEPLGYDVSLAHSGPEGLRKAAEGKYDAVLLDVMLPGIDGFEVLKRLRAKSSVPVLMLTARGEPTDRIAGLDLGADDYLPKTFSTRELLARLRAVIRRSMVTAAQAQEALQSPITVGELRVDPRTRIASQGGKPLPLTPVEFDLLVSLARACGSVKSGEQVFAPFYRPEASRSRDTGGAGLGLAIVRTCIESCKGSVTCRNRQPSGLEVEIRLKAAP